MGQSLWSINIRVFFLHFKKKKKKKKKKKNFHDIYELSTSRSFARPQVHGQSTTVLVTMASLAVIEKSWLVYENLKDKYDNNDALAGPDLTQTLEAYHIGQSQFPQVNGETSILIG